MNEILRELLIEYLDDALPPSQRAEVEELMAADPSAARFVQEHQEIWAALGEAYGDPAIEDAIQASADFRARVTAGVDSGTTSRSWPLQHLLALAACLALSLTFFTWMLGDRAPGAQLSAEDRHVVRYLHVLQEFDVLDSMSAELDLHGEYDVMRAFEGEIEG